MDVVFGLTARWPVRRLIWQRPFAIACSLLQVPLTDALRFASRNPAEFIGVGHFLGRLAPGYRADMVAIDPGPVAVLATWVAGKEELVGEA